MLRALSRFLRDPGNLETVKGVGASLQDSPLAAQMYRHMLKQPGISAMIEDHWRPQPIDLDALAALPAGSLGHCYAEQLRIQGINPADLIDSSAVQNEHDFVIHRLKETHDIVHVLTGFGVDGISELGLQAFNLAQFRSPLAVLLIFAGLLKVLQEDEPLDDLLRALARGFSLGLQARCVVAERLEDHWERPLSAWRETLQLVV